MFKVTETFKVELDCTDSAKNNPSSASLVPLANQQYQTYVRLSDFLKYH